MGMTDIPKAEPGASADDPMAPKLHGQALNVLLRVGDLKVAIHQCHRQVLPILLNVYLRAGQQLFQPLFFYSIKEKSVSPQLKQYSKIQTTCHSSLYSI